MKLEKNDANLQPNKLLILTKNLWMFQLSRTGERQRISVMVIFQKGSMIVKMRDKLEPTCFARLEKKAHQQTKIRNRNVHYIFQNLSTA